MMKKEDIIFLPNKSLRMPSAEIKDFNSPETKKLIDDMLAATLDWEASRKHEVAVGLAAVQIDKLFRAVIVREDFDDYRNKNFFVMINPEIIKLEGLPVIEHEGCLSVKNLYGKVARYPKVKFKYYDRDGKEVIRTAKGFFAKVIQHEVDHLNGKLYVDHIKGKVDSFFRLESSGEMLQLDYEQVTESGIFR